MKAYAIKDSSGKILLGTVSHTKADAESLLTMRDHRDGSRCVEVEIIERESGDLDAPLSASVAQSPSVSQPGSHPAEQPDDIPNGYLEKVEAAIKAGPKLPPDVPIAELEGRCEAPVGALIYTSPPAPEGLSLTDDMLDAGACAFLEEKDKWPEGHQNRSIGHLLRVAISATLAAAPAGKVHPSWVQFVRTVAGPAFSRDDLREEAKLMLAAKEK